MKRKRSADRKRRPSRIAIGIIAEDHSDVAVLTALIGKLARAPFFIRCAVGGGCGKIVGKCRGWAENLRQQGCRYLLLVHDLDERVLHELRSQLVSALSPSPIAAHLIVIPIREIEAWLSTDHVAIAKAMKLKDKLKPVPNPEGIRRPKEYLGDLVYQKSKRQRRYVNALDNEKIAQLCAANNLRRCSSFVPFSDFIVTRVK